MTKRALLILAVVTFGISALLFTTPVGVSAASCRVQRVATQYDGTTWSGGQATERYEYSNTLIMPHLTGCRNIDIRAVDKLLTSQPYDSGYFRVRFYPTSGGSWVTGWKYVNSTNGSTTWHLATSVINGTKYRIESNGRNEYRFDLID